MDPSLWFCLRYALYTMDTRFEFKAWESALAFDKEDEIAKKHGVTVLTRGIPYGVNETWVSVYESEKYIDNLMGLHQESGRGKYIDSARTITVVPFPWDRWYLQFSPFFIIFSCFTMKSEPEICQSPLSTLKLNKRGKKEKGKNNDLGYTGENYKISGKYSQYLALIW